MCSIICTSPPHARLLLEQHSACVLQAYLDTRARVLQLADDDPWLGGAGAGGGASNPLGRGMAGRARGDEVDGHVGDMPSLVLSPDGREIFIAKKESLVPDKVCVHAYACVVDGWQCLWKRGWPGRGGGEREGQLRCVWQTRQGVCTCKGICMLSGGGGGGNSTCAQLSGRAREKGERATAIKEAERIN